MSKPLFERVCIIGLGLIGSSVARAIRAHDLAHIVIGHAHSRASMDYCLNEGIIDEAAESPAMAAQHADLIILATPPGTFEAITHQISPLIKKGAIITDVGSVKQQAIAAISPSIPPHAFFIPAHPIAGSEKTGPEAGNAELFRGRKTILTPEQPALTPALSAIRELWQRMGAEVEMMPAETHDLLYAYVSHLPQLIAFASGMMLSPIPDDAPKDEYFEKFSRLWASDTALWRDIFLANHTALLAALDTYISIATHMAGELSSSSDQSSSPSPLAYTRLFPRLAASCLVATVNTLEKNTGLKAARYAGTGFADVACPALLPPGADIEQISKSHAQISALLKTYIERLGRLRTMIAENQSEALLAALGGKRN